MGLIWLLLVALSVNLNHGVEGGRIISKEEDLKLERQLKSLNKPPIKTIRVDGAVLDCVSIYKQPALDHPLLKNHKIQTEPTSYPNGIISGTSSVDKHPRATINGIDCPQGTVPIRRTRKEELIRAKSFPATSINPQTTDSPGRHLAILKLANFGNIIYHGTQAYINVYNVHVEDDQSTSAQVWVENGPTKDQLNSLQAGWMVAPNLLGDNKTRLFATWSVDGGKKSCFNTLCPGFIQVDRKHFLGATLTPTSTYGGAQFIMHLLLFQDRITGNWWLRIDEINVGYWPKSLLPNLEGGHLQAAWGGLVNGAPNEPSVPMGNGHLPDHDDFYKACYFCRLQFVNESNYMINISDERVDKSMDCPKGYYLAYYGYMNKEMGHAFLFGGPGTHCGV